jgi:tetratricopeptide (TPR) repeat protein
MGLMSKPMLVTVPFLMLLLDYWPLRRWASLQKPPRPHPWWMLVVEKAPFVLLSVLACWVTMRAQSGAIQPLEHLPLHYRLSNAVICYLRYLYKTFWPVDLALPYLHPGQWPLSQFLLAAMVLAGLCIGAFLARGKRPFLFVGWFWFVGTLVPVIGLVQVGTQAMADRYTYVPLIGLFIALVWFAEDVSHGFGVPAIVKAGAVTVLLGVFAVLTGRQVSYWSNSERLFRHAAAVTKDNFIALSNVGGVLFESGRLDEALDLYQQSHRINPRYPEALNSIGAVLASKGSEEAIEWFEKALAVQPTHADALFNLGNAVSKKGQYEQARHYYEASLKVKPANYEARNNLANVLVKLGRIDEAIFYYKSAIEYDPDAPLLHKNLGEMLAAKGRIDEAIVEYRQVLSHTNDAATHYSLGMALAFQGHWDDAILQLCPTNAEAQYNLGYALRVKGQLEQAAQHLQEALRLQPEFPLAHYNVACVLADQGKRDEAVSQLNEALREKPDYKEAREKLRSLTDDK